MSEQKDKVTYEDVNEIWELAYRLSKEVGVSLALAVEVVKITVMAKNNER